MRRLQIAGMAWGNLLAQRGRALISAAGISMGVAVLLVVVGLGLGARELVLSEVLHELPLDTIEVVPKTLDLGLFKVGAGTLFGQAGLDKETLEALLALPGVQAAYPKLDMKLPMGASGGGALFGRRLYTDLFLTGLPAELMKDDVRARFNDAGDSIPVVISDQLVEVYNGSVAPTLGTPKLNADVLKGFRFNITFGRSLMLGRRGARKEGSESAVIVGTSPYAMRLGASIPIEAARRLLAQYGDNAEEQYSGILLKAASVNDVPRIKAGVEAMGLSVDETAARTSRMLTAATTIASFVGILVLLLAGLNIAHSFVAIITERRRELAILRAVGARRSDITQLVLMESMLLGVVGGVVGLALGWSGTAMLDFLAVRFLPEFPFKPQTFFLLPPWLMGVALIAAVSAALCGALLPAMQASRTSVARVLADG